MNNEELKTIIRTAAVKQGVDGVMRLTELCDLSYERVRRVWTGDTTAKISDVCHVACVLGMSLKFIYKGEE